MPSTGTPLVIASRKEGAEYHHEVIPVLQGLNLDANDSTIRKGEFQDANNVRLDTLGDLNVRSGYNEFFYTSDKPCYPLAQMEYVTARTSPDASGKTSVQTLYRYLVTVFYSQDTATSGTVQAWVIDKASTDKTGFLVRDAGGNRIIAGFGSAPIARLTEFGGAIMLSLYDDDIADVNSPHPNGGLYEIFPISLPATSATVWKITKLGKEICPVPKKVNFAAKTSGSLFIYNAKQTNGSMEVQVDPVTGKQSTIELKLDAPYWRAGGQVLGIPDSTVEYMKERLYVPNADEDPYESHFVDKHLIYHPPARAWGYRFVFRRRVTDAFGNPFEIESTASVDMWVQDTIYCPPVLGLAGADASHKITFPAWIWGRDNLAQGGLAVSGASEWRDRGPGARCDVEGAPNPFTVASVSSGAYQDAQGYPTNEDYLALREKYRNSVLGSKQDLTSDPYFFAACWLGWWVNFSIYYPNNQTPYMVAVPASKLKGAPLTIFNFNDFPVPADCFEIDIFRTAHTEPNEKDNIAFANSTSGSPTGDLLFQPNSYGYVGTLKRDPLDLVTGGTFTDDIADTQLQFGVTPDQYDGFLVGQFTGQTMVEYNHKLALGNTRTTYWVETPWALTQPFVNAWAVQGLVDPRYVPGYAATDLVIQQDNLSLIAFCYSYVDMLGNESAPQDVSLDPLMDAYGVSTGLHVTLVFPRGYEPSITQIKIYESHWDSVLQTRHYALRQTINTSANMVQFLNPATSYPLTRPQRTVKDYYGPGDLIWSERNNQFSWPQLNTEREHQYAPITGLESILGELWVWTTESDTLTRMDERTPRAEEENKYVGLIAPHAIHKYNQVVFFLSEFGVQFAVGSGVVQYPAKDYGGVLPYINEIIPGLGRFANAKRAAMGLIQQRQELWLYFPSSIDLYSDPVAVAAGANPANALPQRIFIYKFLDGDIGSFYRNSDIRNMQNYTFDLHEEFQWENLPNANPPALDPSKFRSEPVFFSEGSDGSLFCAYYDLRHSRLTVLDCDYDLAPWPGRTAVEFPLALQLPSTPKQLASEIVKAAFNCTATLYTGQRKRVNQYDVLHGWIDERSLGQPINIPRPGRPDVFKSRGTDIAYESKSYAPRIRVVTEPDSNGNHQANYQGFEFELSLKHHHP